MAGLHCGGMGGMKGEFAERRDRGAIVNAQRVVETVEKPVSAMRSVSSTIWASLK
jgi:hypothetical protein